jgi:bifunctional ADP-heptose synthase (sugar kinase/adenylyltransferase)
LKGLKVLVLGDTIVDEYHYCQPLGKSPKETIVSTRYVSQESFAGGILACANHIADFAGSVSVVTCLGSQNPQQERIDSLLNPKIARKYFFRDDAPTNVKRRYLEPAFLTKMFQIAYLNDTDLPAPVEGEMCRYLKERLPEYDVVVVADYGHGMLTPALREVLTNRSPFLALNVQTNSANLGFNPVTKYDRADYISIDEPELRLALQQKYTAIGPLLDEFALRYPGSTFTITRGHNGSMTRLAGPESKPVEVPSLSSKIVDRVGAGDAYFAITSLLAARRAAPEVLGFTGNAAGALAVEIVGNRSSLQAAPFLKFIRALLA